jgi:hypothetical protein
LEILQNFPSIGDFYIRSSGTIFIIFDFKMATNCLTLPTHFTEQNTVIERDVNSFIFVLLTVFNLFLEPVIHIIFNFFKLIFFLLVLTNNLSFSSFHFFFLLFFR